MTKKKDKPRRVRPQVLKGFRDYPPEDEIARGKIITRAREAVELMGFLPLQTASLELAETLLGPHYSRDSLAELFGFKGPDDVDMALRYEFTVSLARYVAGNPNLALPFRRYQYGNAWRVDKPGPGRFREFTQFDIDIVGTQNLLADSEIIASMVAVLNHLGVERFKVRYSNRKILNGLIQFAGIPDTTGPEVMRVIDKLEKQGREAVLLELGPGRVDISGDKIPGLCLEENQIAQIDKFLDIGLSDAIDQLSQAETLLGHVDISREGIDELRSIGEYLSGMHVDDAKVAVDLTIVRGLGYYTGPVFETTLLDRPEYGSIFSGGRYDNLVSRFLGKSIPGVGSSMGPDRLLAALKDIGALGTTTSISQVLVTTMDRNRLSEYLGMVDEIRAAGIPAEIYAGDTKNLTKQIKYADKVGIPFAVIAGSDEFEANQITVKNLAAGREKAQQTTDRTEWLKAEDIQETIPKDQLVVYLQRQLQT